MNQAEKERRILDLLADEPMSARALGDFAEMNVWQVYPALMRMEKAGSIVSGWERGERPRRRLYWLPGQAVPECVE